MNIGARIKKIRKSLDITQQKFGERIGIKGNTIAQYELGRNEPIDAVVSLICREFNVREEWLRNGTGEMFLDFTEDEFSRAAATLSNDAFVRGLIIEYWKLDEDSRQLFRSFIQKLSDTMQDLEPSVADNHSKLAITVEEAEAEYIKSRSRNAQKKGLSVSNTTAGNAVNN